MRYTLATSRMSAATADLPFLPSQIRSRPRAPPCRLSLPLLSRAAAAAAAAAFDGLASDEEVRPRDFPEEDSCRFIPVEPRKARSFWMVGSSEGGQQQANRRVVLG